MKTVRILLTIFIANMLILTAIYLYIPEYQHQLRREDQFIENLSAAFFFLSVIISLICFFRLKDNSGRRMLLANGFLALVGFLDELSFGERHFDLPMPTIPQVENMKINGVHDIGEIGRIIIVKEVSELYYVLALTILLSIALLLLMIFRYRHQLMKLVSEKYPPFLIFSFFVLLIVLSQTLDLDIIQFEMDSFDSFIEETLEMNAGLTLSFLSWSIYEAKTLKRV